jgi:predicted amidohydrolase YtcJ
VRYQTIAELTARLASYRLVDYGGGFLTVRSLKRQVDGALGTRGAWLVEPYTDEPTTSGLNLEPLAEIRQTAELAIALGFQLCTHAIGDRGNREVFDIYESVMRAHPEKKDLRWRIEHAQHLSPSDVPRFKALGVIASMQAIHAVSDGPWVVRRLGAARAASGAYLWRTLLDAGVVVTNGSDTPIENLDPLAGVAAAVTRRTSTGEVFYGAQRMTRDEALWSYTMANAYAGFEEDTKGSLTLGKLADIVVLSRDITRLPDEQLREARVELTIIGGKVRYRGENAR